MSFLGYFILSRCIICSKSNHLLLYSFHLETIAFDIFCKTQMTNKESYPTEREVQEYAEKLGVIVCWS